MKLLGIILTYRFGKVSVKSVKPFLPVDFCRLKLSSLFFSKNLVKMYRGAKIMLILPIPKFECTYRSAVVCIQGFDTD